MEPRDRNCICLNELAGWGNTGASRAMCKEDSLRSGHRVRRRHAQLDGQPRARRPKLAFDGGQRDIQRLRCFLERQSAEVPLLQDPAASLIHGGEALKGLIQLDDGLDRVIRNPGGQVITPSKARGRNPNRAPSPQSPRSIGMTTTRYRTYSLGNLTVQRVSNPPRTLYSVLTSSICGSSSLNRSSAILAVACS